MKTGTLCQSFVIEEVPAGDLRDPAPTFIVLVGFEEDISHSCIQGL